MNALRLLAAISGAILLFAGSAIAQSMPYGPGPAPIPGNGATTGSGAIVLANTPALVTPVLGVATGTSVAIAGCTISTNNLCTAGAANFGNTTTAPQFNASGAGVFGLSNSSRFVLGVSNDTGLSRASAGVFDVGNGAAGNASGSMIMAGLTVSGLATATGSYVCVSAGVFSLEAVACPASDRRRKNPVGTLDPTLVSYLLDGLTPVTFTYKSTATYGSNIHVGLYAQDVCKMDERLCSRDAHGEIQNYDERGVIAYLIADRSNLRRELARQQREIDHLKRAR